MASELHLSATAKAELQAMRAFDRRRVMGEIERQLTDAPAVESRNRKQLGDVEADFYYRPPLWELRVGEWRVFYDVEAESEAVYVRSVRRKGPEQTTQEVTRGA